jgi:dolichol-phosphate mannosyltransferase
MKFYPRSSSEARLKNSVISVVAPVFNEAEGIRSFAAVVVAELEQLTDTWEIVLVDDGSTDSTWETLQSLHAEDPRIKILRFSRNFGHQLAITAGMQYACGDAVIVMDSDLQHPPKLIPLMVGKWKEGFEVVYTVRSYGEEIGWFKRTTSNLFYQTLNFLSDTKLEPGVSDFRLLDRAVLDQFNAMPENVRFIRGMIRWLGFRQTSIPFTAAPRFAGQSKYSFAKMCRFALEGITSFSVLPLRWITLCGLAVAAVSLCYAAYVLGEVWMTGITTPGWPTLIVAILFLGGMQLTALGIVGEYVGRIYMETKRRPLFVVQEEFGFNAESRDVPLADREKAA